MGIVVPGNFDGSRFSSVFTLKLPGGLWTYDRQLRLGSPGGFATVFAGSGPDGSPVAIKIFRGDRIQESHREFRVAQELTSSLLKHVMRVLDAGTDAVSLQRCIVMPRADRTLQYYLGEKFRLGELETVEILLQILDGLDEVPTLVHRDLKPSNILLSDGVWKVADFGIARFIEEATASQTLGWAFSPDYGAPEQWRGEPVSRETDLYALGCLAYELACGHKPFEADNKDLCRQRHLTEEPERIERWSEGFWLIIQLCLRKLRETRLSSDRLREMLRNCLKSPESVAISSTPAKLKAIGERLAAASAPRETADYARRLIEQRRLGTVREGYAILRPVLRKLLQAIDEANLDRRPKEPLDDSCKPWERTFGPVSIRIDFPNRDGGYPEDSFSMAPFDAVCQAIVQVTFGPVANRNWSASLWYADFGRTGTFRWYEAAYQNRSPPLNYADLRFPHHIEPILIPAVFSPSPRDTEAYKPRPIDDENAEQFIERWLTLVGVAAENKLEPPPSVPMGDWWPSLA